MTLYHLWQATWADYDEVNSFIIRANDEDEARKIASESAGCEKAECWLDLDRSYCDEVDNEGESGIIVRDFNAG